MSHVPFRYLKMHFTASQWTLLGSCMNWDTVAVANAMSSLVPTTAYMSEPMASRYGMSAISAFSAAVDGLCSCESWSPGSIGTLTGFAFVRLKQVRIVSMKAHCD